MTRSNAVYVYQADTYCEECADAIKADLQKQADSEVTTLAKIPSNPDDETSYDSDEWPKGPFYDEESGSPTHCGHCHAFLEQPLTGAGYRYVRDALTNKLPDELSEVERTWADFYSFTHFQNEYSSAHEWLESAIASAVTLADENYQNNGLATLADIARTLAGAVDGDTIQDHFQSDMEADDYFKKTGWYTDEYNGD